jgi:hypothetical protein
MVRTGWKPNMKKGTGDDAKQVKCLIASEGHLWMRGYYDKLPPEVRRRLAQSRHNICPACMTEDAEAMAHARGLRRPNVAIYMAAIISIERALDQIASQ